MYTTIVLAKMNTIKASCELPSLDWQIVRVHEDWTTCEGVCVCVCVCVSGNAPWLFYLTSMGGATPLCNGLYLCTCTVSTSASMHVHSLTC